MMEWSSIDKLDKALEEAIAENSITPLVKMELASKVRQRREMDGKGDLQISFDPPKVYQLSEEEVIKIEQRKWRNRRSAERARIKRKSKEDELHQECQILEDQQRSLHSEMRQLNNQVKQYKKILYTHLLFNKTTASPCKLHNYTRLNTLMNT